MVNYRHLRVQGPPGEAAIYVSPTRAEADLLRSAFGEPDLVGPEEELIRDLAGANPPEGDEDEGEDEGEGPSEDSAI